MFANTTVLPAVAANDEDKDNEDEEDNNEWNATGEFVRRLSDSTRFDKALHHVDCRTFSTLLNTGVAILSIIVLLSLLLLLLL